MLIYLYKDFYCNILDNPMPLVEKHKNINVDFIMKNLYTSNMECEKFSSLLQVC